MTAPDGIHQLIEKFDRHKPGSETEVRVQFVDELFTALGWNMRDKRQVRHEPRVTIKEAGFERSKRPDYSFHIGSATDFFVETKMPHVNLERNPIPAFQLRRYGWSGNAPVSVLTDFEEFSVYDCRVQPQRSDPASTARLRYYQYGEYIDQWDELESRFSREAVANGALREWVEGKRVRGLFSVDQAFLREMESWREILAREIALHNRDLSQRQLNLLVQRTIDRIVFLRIAEDRNIEQYGRLRSAAADGKQVYEELKILFNEADDKYNSGLFHFGKEKRASEPDRDSLNMHIPDEPLRRIINSLYFPFSAYEFSVLPADILGQVYEQFLGKVIELSSGGAVRVDEKPEVRKAGGVYYTPAYIVDYIVENTVGALLKDKTPEDAEKLRILDPACGSGSFLTGAYQYLLDWHLDYYRERPRQYRNRTRQIAGAGMILSTAEKRRILLNNIYGVDLDQNAVEVSKLSLLLKMLEKESDAAGAQTIMFSAGGRILPDLSGNIKWGNSLIGSDFYRGEQLALFDQEALYKVKPFDWDSEDGFGAIMAAGGFDAVIGNPPYVNVRILGQRPDGDEIKAYYKSRYKTAFKGYDLYVLFLERSYYQLKESGVFGMILPNKIGTLDYSLKARELLLSKTQLMQIVDVSHLSVFGSVGVYPYIIVFRRAAPQENNVHVLIAETESDVTSEQKYKTIPQEQLNPETGLTIHGTIDVENRVPTDTFENRAKLHSGTTGFSAQQVGLFLKEKEAFDGDGFDFVVSGNIDRYSLALGNVRYMKENYQMPVLPRNYFALTANKMNLYSAPKIIIAGMTKILEASYVEGNIALGVQVYAANEIQDNPLYVLGLLNSKFMSYLFRIRYQAKHLAGGYLSINKGQLSKLPIRTIDFDNPADVALHDKMVALVDSMLDWHKQLPDLTGEALRIVNARIAATDREIDTLVYRLYGLSEDEVRVVEGG